MKMSMVRFFQGLYGVDKEGIHGYKENGTGIDAQFIFFLCHNTFFTVNFAHCWCDGELVLKM